MERLALTPPCLRVDLRQTACSTLLSYAGPYQLTLESAVPEFGVELHSYYLGQRQAGFIATSHLAVVTGQPPRVFCAPTDETGATVGDRRRDCVVDHLDQLCVLLGTVAAGAIRIDVGEAALERMDDSSSRPDPAGGE